MNSRKGSGQMLGLKRFQATLYSRREDSAYRDHLFLFFFILHDNQIDNPFNLSVNLDIVL